MRLGNVIIRDLDVGRAALLCAVSHGQIHLDGVCLTREDLNMDLAEVKPGAVVSLYARRASVNGTRVVSASANDQLELA